MSDPDDVQPERERALLRIAREPQRRGRVVRTPHGFVKLSFLGDRALASEYDDDGWPTRQFVRPLRRGDGRLVPILRRGGFSSDEARALDAEVTRDWPDTTSSLGRMVLIASVQFTLSAVGAVALVRVLLARAKRN